MVLDTSKQSSLADWVGFHSGMGDHEKAQEGLKCTL